MDSIQFRSEDLDCLKDWIRKQPHLPQNISDDQLKLFLHSCYYRLETTKKTIDTYYTLKTGVPEFFANRSLDAPGMKHILNVVKFCTLPKLTNKGYAVLFAKLTNFETSQFVLDDAIKLLFMVVDSHLKQKGLLPGLIFLFDMTGVSLGHLTRINLSSVRKYFNYVQEAMPVRLKAIHIINVSPVMPHIMTLIRPFIHKQLVQYIHLHSSDEVQKLYTSIQREILPKDYNGEEASMDTLSKFTLELLREHADWFQEDEKMKIDDAKRQNKNHDKFSLQGSFKKLELD